MSFRIQFSLRTLLLLTLLVGGGLAFVVMPWWHRQQQLAILERLRNDYGLRIEKCFCNEKQAEEDFYTAESYGLRYEEFNDELIRLINSSELIGAVKLHFQAEHGENVVGLNRFLQLRHITELELNLVKLDEAQMQVLQKLPLKLLRITSFESQFQTWPINRDMEEFYFLCQYEATSSFQLNDHPNLRHLQLQSMDAKSRPSVEIRNCPALEVCDISMVIDSAAPTQDSTLIVEGLKKLETLRLQYDGFEPTRLVIRDLPELTSFGLDGIRWNKINESRKWRLRCLRYMSDQEISDQELAAILGYPKLMELELSFPHPQREVFDIPVMPELQDFRFSHRRRLRMPAALTIQYLRKMPNLTHLDLALVQFDTTLQEQVAKYSKLRTLSIDVQGDFPTLDFLQWNSKLTRMELSCRQFSIEQINFLATLQQIDVLDLNSTANQITDFQSFASHPANYLRFNHQDIKPALNKALANTPADFSEAEPTEKIPP